MTWSTVARMAERARRDEARPHLIAAQASMHDALDLLDEALKHLPEPEAGAVRKVRVEAAEVARRLGCVLPFVRQRGEATP